LGLAVTMLRKRHGLSCAELAEKIEEEPSVIERIERGDIDADWATLRVLARALNLPLFTLLELAEGAAPGEGGEAWRRWSRETNREASLD
jgi:ribosome-binding protein aMBF1 (putative translation factor)